MLLHPGDGKLIGRARVTRLTQFSYFTLRALRGSHYKPSYDGSDLL